MSHNTSRRSLVFRIKKTEMYLKELPLPLNKLGKKKLALWKRTMREARRFAIKLGDGRNVCTPLEKLCISETIIKKLASHNVHSLETLGNIDTSILRAALRRQHDRLISDILVKLHPDSSSR